MSIYVNGSNYYKVDKSSGGGSTTIIAPFTAEITLTAQNILDGFAIIMNNPTAVPGAKTDTIIFPRYGIQQEYGQDFTAIVSDNREAFYLIWKTSGSIDNIATPSYPAVGLTNLLVEGDVIDITHYVE